MDCALRAAPSLQPPPVSAGPDLTATDGALTLLGMTLVDTRLEGEARRKLGSTRGVAVVVAERNREAFRGGVRNGDVLAEINSVRINSLHDVQRVLRHHDPHQPLFVFLFNQGGWRFTNLSFVS